MYMWPLPALHLSLEGRQTSIIPACQLLSTVPQLFSGLSHLAQVNLEYINVRTPAGILPYRHTKIISPKIHFMKLNNISQVAIAPSSPQFKCC